MQQVFQNKEVKNAGWLIGGKIVQMLLALVVSIFTARYLGPSNFGLINYGMAFAAFFTSLCTLGINSVIIKDFVDNPGDEGKTIGTTILLRLVSSFLSAILIIIIVSIIDKKEPLTIVVVALCSISLLFMAFDTINYWFQSKYQSKITSIATLLAYIVVSTYRIILIFTNKDIRWFALATSIDYICIALLLLLAYKKYEGPRLSFSWIKGKYLLNKSYHYILSGAMVAIYGQIDKLMLMQMLGKAEVGYYSVATSICSTWVFILAAIIDSMYPTILKLHKSNKIGYIRKNKQLYAIIFYISICVSVFFLLFGGYAVRFFYGESYKRSVLPLQVATWYTAFSYLGVARNAWIVCENNQKYLKYMYLGAVIINIFLNLVFIPLLGATGAAVASLITQIFTSIILPMIFKDMRPNAKMMLEAIMLKSTFDLKK